LHWPRLLISDGAQVEGNIIVQGVTVCGRVKGAIRAVRVKLQNGGAAKCHEGSSAPAIAIAMRVQSIRQLQQF
jgi:cytoskeletal protein CcmA (bactofilin family)